MLSFAKTNKHIFAPNMPAQIFNGTSNLVVLRNLFRPLQNRFRFLEKMRQSRQHIYMLFQSKVFIKYFMSVRGNAV